RRGGRGVTQLDLDRMTLVGPDRKAVLTERKSLFVVAGDDILKLFERKFNPAQARSFNQFLHGRPTGLAEPEADLFRLMPQHEAEKFADLDCAVVHACLCSLTKRLPVYQKNEPSKDYGALCQAVSKAFRNAGNSFIPGLLIARNTVPIEGAIYFS